MKSSITGDPEKLKREADLINRLAKCRVTLVDASDLAAERPKPLVVAHKRDKYFDLLIYPNGGAYPIEFSRINNSKKLLGWIHHLCGKCNVTTEHIEQLIDAVRENLGVAVDMHS